MNYKFRRFSVDHNLIFVIQSMTKDSTEEILTTLHEAATSITTESLKSSRARQLNKKAKFFYKKGTIPILVCCNGTRYEYHERYEAGKPYNVDVEIRFPKKILKVDPADLEKMVGEKFEKSIGLRDTTTRLTDIEKPHIEVPRSLKGVL